MNKNCNNYSDTGHVFDCGMHVIVYVYNMAKQVAQFLIQNTSNIIEENFFTEFLGSEKKCFKII